MDAKRPWSPIECVGSKPFGKVVDDPVPLEWHLSQKWKSLSPLKSGHARIVRCLDDGDTLLVLEATQQRMILALLLLRFLGKNLRAIMLVLN